MKNCIPKIHILGSIPILECKFDYNKLIQSRITPEIYDGILKADRITEDFLSGQRQNNSINL